MRIRPDVVFAAPGAGLGHLVRTCSIAQYLKDFGVESCIVTFSRFSKGMAALSGCSIERISSRSWMAEVGNRVKSLGPELVVLDSFPFGIRGEWLEERNLEFVSIARRLNLDEYSSMIGNLTAIHGPWLERVIKVEPLPENQETWLKTNGGEMAELNSPIRFHSNRIRWKPAGELESFMAGVSVCLIVHSGPKEEIGELIEVAETEGKKRNPDGKIGVISPEPPDHPGISWFEHFPASDLFGQSSLIITGGGYNCIAEGAPFFHKHLAIPFNRRFDDQQGRVNSLESDPFWKHPVTSGLPRLSRNGGREAAEKIRHWLSR